MTNSYSTQWFDLFLRRIPTIQTQREIAFLRAYLPKPNYRTILDLCCGAGRHTNPLAAAGYQVLGLDQNCTALAQAQEHAPSTARYIEGDMRKLSLLPTPFDAVLCLWQSFGYFDDTTNADIIRQISSLLRPAGRFILDIYHRQFFEEHQGSQQFERDDMLISETKTIRDGRLSVELAYGGTMPADRFEWQLYTPAAIIALCRQYQLDYLLACSNFDPQTPPSRNIPRMQLVFQKVAEEH